MNLESYIIENGIEIQNSPEEIKELKIAIEANHCLKNSYNFAAQYPNAL